MEYRGYGLYREQKSSEGLLIDALAVYDYINREMCIPEHDIYLFGRSLGCTPACWIGSQRQPGLIILVCPFRSLQDAAKAIVGWFLGSLLVNRFDNTEYLKKVKAPVFILHGQMDALIPYQQSESLINSCEISKGTCLVLPPLMTHNYIDCDDLTRPLIAFLNNLGQGLVAAYQGNEAQIKKSSLIYPPDNIIQFEKSYYKYESFVWKLAQQYRLNEFECESTSSTQTKQLKANRMCSRNC